MKRKYKHEDTFNDTKPRSGNKREIVKLTDHVDVFKFKNAKYVGARLVGPVFKQAVHWVRIKTKEGKETGIPKKCFRYDADADSFDTTKECPYCDKLNKEYAARQRYYTNAIIRQIEEDAPDKFTKKYSKTEAKSGFKDGLDSKAWTPVRVLDLPAGVAGKIKGLADLNKHTVDGKKKAMPLSHEEYGRDIEIKYDKDAAAAQAYDVQKGDASALDDTQQNYLHWNLEEVLEKIAASLEEDIKTAREEVKRLKVAKKKDDGDDEGEYSDDGDAKGKKKGGKKADKKKPKKEESDEESDESSDEGSDESSDEASSESSDESSDEGSDESSDEGSDEKPAKKKPGKKPAKKKEDSDESSDESSEEADEESDFNMDESSDEDSDEKPAKKGSKKKPAKKEESDEESDESSDEGSDESSDESSDEGSDEESDEKPAKKSSKSSSKKPAKKSSSKKKKGEDSDESSF